MPKILYLAHDLSDPAVRRRVLMLGEGGASVTLAGFRRGDNPLAAVSGIQPVELGRTADGRFAQRIGAVARASAGLSRLLANLGKPEVIVARNLEMLVLASRASRLLGDVPVVYECLDIHRLLLRKDRVGSLLRGAEAFFGRRTKLVWTSSPAFIEHYFNPLSGLKAPFMLLENKVLALDGLQDRPVMRVAPLNGQPWRIGWFGALRCRKSLAILSEFSRRMNGKVEIVLRGRPAYSEFEDFDRLVAAEPHLRFEGPYRNPEDLARIYGEVHFTWAIDFFEEGQNSEWLLPNRLYEGCLYGAVPIALRRTQTGRFLAERSTGVLLDTVGQDDLAGMLEGMTATRYEALATAVYDQPVETWLADRQDCHVLVESISHLKRDPSQVFATAAGQQPEANQEGGTTLDATGGNSTSCLIIIPCLNEAKHIEALVRKLTPEMDALQARIVVADGGSTDGTREIVARLSEADSRVLLLDNPRRLQSAAINLAVATFGRDCDYLIRIDAHGDYPEGYCRELMADAVRTGADSVVVAMETIGFGRFQKATAVAQNSKLGNGGSKHREGAAGHWADHGHHALMKVSAFEAVGGYDETFSHNEDAELDFRLRKAGFRIWMTDRTRMIYYPRDSVPGLFRQYLNYGRGRARNILKHRSMPSIRQMLPLLVVPVFIAALLAVVNWAAAVPFALWAVACLSYGVWMAVGQRNPYGPLAAISAMVMHFAWSAGFWMEVLGFRRRKASS